MTFHAKQRLPPSKLVHREKLGLIAAGLGSGRAVASPFGALPNPLPIWEDRDGSEGDHRAKSLTIAGLSQMPEEGLEPPTRGL
jgi:hypothetical protein